MRPWCGGLNNESAQSVIDRVNDDNRYRFDQLCRIKAIALAARLDMRGMRIYSPGRG
nr:hypothetical protein [Aeromonas caviae]